MLLAKIGQVTMATFLIQWRYSLKKDDFKPLTLMLDELGVKSWDIYQANMSIMFYEYIL